MFAKQTLTSASLVCTLLGTLAPAHAEPEPDAPADGEALPDERGPSALAAPAPPSATPLLVAPTPPPSLAPPKRSPTGYIEIGAGFQTDDGFIARAEVGNSDLFGTGNRLALTATVSERRQRFVTRFVDPDLFGSRVAVAADVYYDRRRLPGFWREASGGTLTLSTEVREHWRSFIVYRFEAVSVEEDAVALARGGRARDDRLLVGALRMGFVFDNRDNPIAPLRGGRIGATLELADRDLGSDVNMLKHQMYGDWHQPLGALTLHVGGTLESVHARGPTSGIPRSERLYLDGSSEVRGYEPGAFAPLGGFAKATWRSELEVPVISKWGISAVGFFDAAAIVGDHTLHRGASVGAGLLWRSPIGPIRLDYAIPLDGAAPGLVFGFGGF